jgi:Predicted transcriptional regulators
MSRPRTRPSAIDDVRLAAVAGLIADEARARILLALSDGRALPASTLAREAGVLPSTGSSHLGKLLDGGLVVVEQHGRFRYFRIAGAEVAECLEKLAQFAQRTPSRSERIGTREHRLRIARTCYNHLAGRLGVAIMRSLVERKLVSGHDGIFYPDAAIRDRLSARGFDIEYKVTPAGMRFFDDIGVDAEKFHGQLLRYCVDWSEQAHHLSGPLGAALLSRLQVLNWVSRSSSGREVAVTHDGVAGFREKFGLDWQAVREPGLTRPKSAPMRCAVNAPAHVDGK